jgi:cbb3-type cytochrome oxidase subunit 3
MLSLGSFVIGAILLMGLFVYDVFWVFGTEVRHRAREARRSSRLVSR